MDLQLSELIGDWYVHKLKMYVESNYKDFPQGNIYFHWLRREKVIVSEIMKIQK